MNILVLDIGTSSIRALLFDENGNCKGKVQNRYCPTYISDSMVEQQPGELSLVLRQVVREISQRAKHQGLALEGISISSQRSSITALDRDGIPLLPFIMWQDKRTGSLCDKLKEYDSVILERSGAGVNSVFSGVKMSWIRENCPEIYSRTYKFVNIFEYILFTMTGIFGTDTTYASRSNLMNIRNFVWDKDLMELFRIEEEKLCDIFTPGQVIGFKPKCSLCLNRKRPY